MFNRHKGLLQCPDYRQQVLDPLYGAHPRMRPNKKVMFMRLLERLNIGSMETREFVPEPLPEGLTAPGGGATSWLNPFAFYKHMGETWLQEWVQNEGGTCYIG